MFNINNKKILISLLLLFIGVFLSGCGCSSSDEKKSEDKGVTFAQISDIVSLDPGVANDAPSVNAIKNVYETLIGLNEDSTDFIPLLAESYKISEDGKQYTFALRKNIKFHDGTPFNSEAVKANVQRERGTKAEYLKMVWGGVSSVETPNEHTVVIKLNEPLTDFLYFLSMPLGASMVSPKGIRDGTIPESPSGTGPFKFESREVGQSVVFKRNEDYWDSKNKPTYTTLSFKVISDSNSCLLALKNNEIDLFENVDPSLRNQVDSENSKLKLFPGSSTKYLCFNTTKLDEQMRKGLCHALDMEKIVRSLYKGNSEYATSFIPKGIPGFGDSKPPKYDLEAAKNCVKASNSSKNIQYICLNKDKNIAEAIQDQVKAVGVNIQIETREWAPIMDDYTKGKFDMGTMGWKSDYPGGMNFMQIFCPGNDLNYSKCNIPEFNNLYKQVLTEAFGEGRTQKIVKMNNLIAENFPVLPICQDKQSVAFNTKKLNGEPSCHLIYGIPFNRLTLK
ncbi:MAG: ABC transporter substrate-binding protein [Oscillospiraceae bacterium]|jgi:peptide/nickel transport system substrate-binding protein|nr:ABC transporter substrate-binding protein [Oscillospiraceae bacterium]